MILDFDQLKSTDPSLHYLIVQATGFCSGTHEVDGSDFVPSTRRRLSIWWGSRNRNQSLPPTPAPSTTTTRFEQRLRELQAANATPPAPLVEPPASSPAVVKHEEPESIREALDVSKNEERRRVEQQARDEDAFVARLEEWGRSGLETTQENANLIVDWIRQHPQLKGYVSAQAVDLAVQWLGPDEGSNVLTWKPKTAPAPPPPAEPAGEVLADLQLPLDADEQTMKHASVKALQDLIKRRRAATNQQYVRRGFGSSF